MDNNMDEIINENNLLNNIFVLVYVIENPEI